MDRAGEKRQQTVAEIMGEHKLIRIRMRKMDDLGNEIKNGGAWATFKQHLAVSTHSWRHVCVSAWRATTLCAMVLRLVS